MDGMLLGRGVSWGVELVDVVVVERNLAEERERSARVRHTFRRVRDAHIN